MKYNWIEAKAISSGRHIKVRHGEPGGRIFLDGEGTMYTIFDLDFTVNYAEMRRKAKNKGINSHIDKLWVSGDTIYLPGADTEKAEQFICSLGALGYDTKILLNEYKTKGKITI